MSAGEDPPASISLRISDSASGDDVLGTLERIRQRIRAQGERLERMAAAARQLRELAGR